MTVSFTGDFSKLAQLVKGMEQLTKLHGFTRQANTALAEEALSQVQQSFSAGTDPYGRPWKPLRSRTGRPLRDTGRLFNSLHAPVRPYGFDITSNVRYARVHNQGAVIRAKNAPYLRFKVGGPRGRGSWVSVKSVTIPRRQFIPTAKRMPASWTKNFKAVLRALRKQRLGR